MSVLFLFRPHCLPALQFNTLCRSLLLDGRGEIKAPEWYWQANFAGDCMADATCNLATLESKAVKTDKAFDCFTKSLKYDPRHLESHYDLANLYFDIGNLRLARQHYEIAAEIAPKLPNISFNLELVLVINEDFTAVVETLDKYKELVPEKEGSKTNELLTSLKRSLAAQR